MSKTTNLHRDANSATTVCLDALKLMGSPIKKSKKSSGKGTVASLKESIQLGCVSQDTEPPKKSILQIVENWDHIASSHCPRAHGTT